MNVEIYANYCVAMTLSFMIMSKNYKESNGQIMQTLKCGIIAFIIGLYAKYIPSVYIIPILIGLVLHWYEKMMDIVYHFICNEIKRNMCCEKKEVGVVV